MSSPRAFSEKNANVLDIVDKGATYTNAGLGVVTSLSALLLNPNLGPSALAIASAMYENNYGKALYILHESGLFEQFFDSGVHFYNGRLSKDSSKIALSIGMALDLCRTIMAITKQVNHSNTIPSFLNIPDAAITHPANMVVNAMRLTSKWCNFHRSTSSAEAKAAEKPSPDVGSSNMQKLKRN